MKKAKFILIFVCITSCSIIANAQGWLEKQRDKHKLEGNEITSVELSFHERKSELSPGGEIHMIAIAYPAKGRKMKSEGAGNGKTAWNNYEVEVDGGTFNKESGIILISNDPNKINSHRVTFKVSVKAYPSVTQELEIPLTYDEDIKVLGDGASGRNGKAGSEGSQGSWGAEGNRGGNGGDGGNGENAHSFEVWATSYTDDDLQDKTIVKIMVKDLRTGWIGVYCIDPESADFSLSAEGGRGGCGGRGGKGGQGGPARSEDHLGGDGGRGGNGGDGGNGGNGGSIVVHLDPSASQYKGVFNLENGGGKAGCRGDRGFGGMPGGFEGGKGKYGSEGGYGSSGVDGKNGAKKEIIVEDVNIDWSSIKPTSTPSSGGSSGSGDKSRKIEDGVFIAKYPNGQINYKGKLTKDKKKQGKWTYYREDGTLKKEENYNEKGVFHGSYKEYSTEEVVMEEGEYVNGEKSGEWNEYRPDGTIKESIVYDLEQNTTVEIEYYKSGEKEKVEHFKNDRLHGSKERYRSNGNPKEKEMYQDGKRHGLCVSYHSNGDLSSETTYENGVKSGPYKKYKRGKLSEEGNYDNRVESGPWTEYHQNGEIKAKYTYDNGDITGDYVAFHDNGTKKEEGTYVNDHREGEWKVYDEKGNLEVLKYYVDGDREGKYLEYDDNVLEKEGTYKEDKKTGHWKFYGSNGKLWKEGDYVDGKKSGEWITYNMDTGEVEEREQH